MTHPFHIEAPRLAMHFAIALNRITALFTQAIENNDPVLAGACLATLSEWVSVSDSDRARMMTQAVFCPHQLDDVGDGILAMCADETSAVQVIEAALYRQMNAHYAALSIVDRLMDGG